MFFRNINSKIKVSLTIPQYAEELFVLIDKNREYLKRWLPWLETVAKPSDTNTFIQKQLQKFIKGDVLNETIFYENKIAGILSFNEIDKENGIGYIGYWLGEQYNGNGIMTLAVSDLIKLGFDYLPI